MFEAIDTNQSGAIELDELKNELKTNHGITSDEYLCLLLKSNPRAL